MSDKKLNLSHKLAGVIDRLIKTTRVKEVDLNTFKGMRSVNLRIESVIKRGVPFIAFNERVIDCVIEPQLFEVIGNLKKNKVFTISLSELNTNIKAENLHITYSGDVCDIPTNINTKTEDVFKKFNISSKLNYKTKIRELNLRLFKPKILSVHRLDYPRIIDNYYLIKKTIISKKSVKFDFLSEKEQLIYWRKAVIQTKRDPKGLELMGVYYDVPYYNIENFKIDFSMQKLSYRLKENTNTNKLKVCDIIIFRDISKKKGIIIEN